MAGFGTTQEEELERILRTYEDDHRLKLHATRKDVFDPADAERAEMIIFDWGGMSLGNDLLGHQIRTLTRWAEDHPLGARDYPVDAVVERNTERDPRRTASLAAEHRRRRRPNAEPAWWLAAATRGQSAPR